MDTEAPAAPRPLLVTETSEQIGELAAALAKAQGAITGAKKDADNPFFKSKYADLESVWAVCRQPLSDHALAVVQTSEVVDPQGVVIATTLVHASGQWMRGRLRMVPVKADPQGIGSCITYARRYALAAMVGVYQVDDDGNDASGKGASGTNGLPEPRRASARPPAPVATEPEVVPVDDEPPPNVDHKTGEALTLDGELSDAEKYGKLATAKEIGSLMGALTAAGISTDELKAYVWAQWGIKSRKQLRKVHLVVLSKWIAAQREPGMDG
jgi:hypothetical protein